MFRGKREMLARGLYWSGMAALLHVLPKRDCLLVLNYHRIGNPDEDLFDPGVFSATADELDEQLSQLKRRLRLITLEEAQAFVEGRLPREPPSCRVLITFDDGYLDNYQAAFPILRSHGAQGVFFLATGMVGSCDLPWWDTIAFLVKTASRRRFTLRYPVSLTVDLDEAGVNASLQDVLQAYKRPENTEPERFIGELKEEAKAEEPPVALRRFLSWDEAREMSGSGMAIGSHTHSHHVLSQLTPDHQREELRSSRTLFQENLGTTPQALAYPVGAQDSFTSDTENLARASGYRMGFSFYGGTNLPGQTNPFNIKRISAGESSRIRLSVQSGVCGATGRFWP